MIQLVEEKAGGDFCARERSRGEDIETVQRIVSKACLEHSCKMHRVKLLDISWEGSLLRSERQKTSLRSQPFSASTITGCLLGSSQCMTRVTPGSPPLAGPRSLAVAG